MRLTAEEAELYIDKKFFILTKSLMIIGLSKICYYNG
jgi:hypothetical protein